MTIDYPHLSQLPGLRSLWKEAFSDEDVFLDAFFDAAFSPRRCRCISEGERVLAALYWFEGSCGGQKFAYLYAVATAKEKRGQGLFSALLADTKKLLAENGFDGILLVPETKDLGAMYEKFGFSPCTTIRRVSVDAGAEAASVREIGPEEFSKLRREMLPKNAVIQERETLAFLATQCHFWAGDCWLAVGQIYNDALHCAEFLGEESVIPGLLQALQVPCGHFRMPGAGEPFAYLLPLHGRCIRPAYFGLALD